MSKNNKLHQLMELLDSADPARINGYMNMFDRVLLYTMAANMLPKEAIESTINLWSKIVKKTIDIDATRRTKFLESTANGRAAKLSKEPDGEDIRLHFLKQLDIAHQAITSQFEPPENLLDSDPDINH